MRIPPAVRALTTRQRLVLGAAGMLVLTALVLLVVLPDGEGDVSLETRSDDSTSTTSSSTSTTLEPTTTTGEVTTTTAAVTTTVPATVASTTTPPTVPPTPPPPTTVPQSGSLDMSAVLAFAKAGGPGSAPRTTTGATTCPAFINRPSDAGDDTVRDISDWSLARYCDGIYRAVLATADESPLDSFWLEVDSGPGGCGGIDRVVIGWLQGSSGRGAIVATPGCAAGSWSWVDAAGYPVYNGSWLQLDFRGTAIGDPAVFSWRGAVRGVGESGAAIDRVPSSGTESFSR